MHSNGNWMNDDQRSAMSDAVAELEDQRWQLHPGNDRDIVNGIIAGQRLRTYGIIKAPIDLLEKPVGSVIKTGVSAYERLS